MGARGERPSLLHVELFDLHLAAVVDDRDVLDERIGGGVGRKRGFVAPGLADEEDAGAGRRRENVVGNAAVLFERGGGQFLGGGEGGIVSKTIAGKKRLVLLSARHVAATVAAMGCKVEVGFMDESGGIVRNPVQNHLWLVDGDRDDDIAVLDLTGEIDHSSIDLDSDTPVKSATSDRFEELGIKPGGMAFAVCGNVGEENFAPKTGWYLGKRRIPSSPDELCIFAFDTIPGNSGSPMFVMANDEIYFVGVFSSGTKDGGPNLAAVVPLDNLMPLLREKGLQYFTSDKKTLKATALPR